MLCRCCLHASDMLMFYMYRIVCGQEELEDGDTDSG